MDVALSNFSYIMLHKQQRRSSTKNIIMSDTLAHLDQDAVLAEALLNAGQQLGLTRKQLGQVVGRDRTRLKDGLRPSSKAGELALIFIRCYRGLYALVDGDKETMRHWMKTPNRGTGGIPLEQVQTTAGLVTVLNYLDAIRGKV